MVNAIMYHYVRPKDDWRGSVPIEPIEFERHIIKLRQKYSIIAPEHLHTKTDKPKCIITFDDATKDQYTIAFPILKKYDVPAYFAVMSGPLEQRRVPTFHLVHAVLSHFSDEEVWEELQKKYGPIDISGADKYYGYEHNMFRKYNKFTLNILLSELDSRAYLESKLQSTYKDLDAFIDDFYISIDQLKEMNKAGMSLGVHCVNHLPYNNQPQKYYDEEIAPCKFFMEKKLGIVPRYYTPAFGGGVYYNNMLKNLTKLLRENGIINGFAINNENNIMNDFWISRIDCNHLEEFFYNNE